MNESSEQGWVERAKQGDAAAIAELYRRFWRAVRATAYGVTADLDLAEDAACEAFYAALENLADLKDPRGRRRLRDVAERIMKGTRPTDPRREQILQQLRDAMDEGINSEAFYQAVRQALRLRPVPREMLRRASAGPIPATQPVRATQPWSISQMYVKSFWQEMNLDLFMARNLSQNQTKFLHFNSVPGQDDLGETKNQHDET